MSGAVNGSASSSELRAQIQRYLVESGNYEKYVINGNGTN